MVRKGPWKWVGGAREIIATLYLSINILITDHYVAGGPCKRLIGQKWTITVLHGPYEGQIEHG